MTPFTSVLGDVFPVFLVAIAGVLMRRLNWLTEEADQSLLRVTVNVLAPCLILDSILRNDALKVMSNVLLAPLVGFGTVAFGMLVAYFLFGAMGSSDAKARRTFALCVGVYNYGYVPIPLATSLFDRETLGVLLVHNLGVEVAMWTLGLLLLGGAGGQGGLWKRIFNPPVIAILVAMVLNVALRDHQLPAAITNTVSMLGKCAIPMGLILIGATIADHLGDFHLRAGWPVVSGALLLRLAVLPVLFLLLAYVLPCTRELKRVILLQAAMPAAVFPIVMAKHYGGSASIALRVAVATSVVALLTIPIWLQLGRKFLQL